MSVLVFTWTLTRTKVWFPSSVLLPVCRHFQHELPEAVSSRSPHQAAPSGLHHPHPPLDFCAVLQSPALRLPAHRHALLHLRHHRHAGGGRRIVCLFNHQSPGCDSNECFLGIRCLATLSWMTTLTSPNTTTSRPSPVRWCCCSGRTAERFCLGGWSFTLIILYRQRKQNDGWFPLLNCVFIWFTCIWISVVGDNLPS